MQLERIKGGPCHVVCCKKGNAYKAEEAEADDLCGICQYDMNNEEKGEESVSKDNPTACLLCLRRKDRDDKTIFDLFISNLLDLKEIPRSYV